MKLGLENKTVIITGATGGIGRSICSAFLNEGSVLIPFYRNKNKLDQLAEFLNINKSGDNSFFPIQVDVKSTDSVNHAVNLIRNKYKKIDVLINCIGISHEKPFLLMGEDEWDEEISINLSSTARIIRIVLKYMFIAKKGAIINVSSVLAIRYGRGVVAYSSAKAAINRLTEALATEVGEKGIRINSVCPGVIKTSMSEAFISRVNKQIVERTALKRLGTPEDVVPSVLFLASDLASSFITGQKIIVDGGVVL